MNRTTRTVLGEVCGALAVIALGGAAFDAEAAPIAIGTAAVANTQEDIAIGTLASATGGLDGGGYYYQAIAIGTRADARDLRTIAIGESSAAGGDGSVALGVGAEATGASGNTAIGSYSNAYGASGSTALGSFSMAGGENATAVGLVSRALGQDSVAIGLWALSTGTGGVALGSHSQAGAANSVAVGNGANASQANSVALGANSTTSVGAQTGYTGAYMAAGSSNSVGEVSMGSAGSERTVTHVADGVNATDAVNVRQLSAGVQYAIDNSKAYTDQRVDNISNGAAGMFRVSPDNTAAPSATGTNSAAGGAGAVAVGTNSLAVGNGSQAFAANSVALGAGSIASRANSVSVGSVGNERQITHVAAGTAGTDAVNLDQLRGSEAGGVRYDRNADGSVNYNQVTLGNPGAGGATTIRNVAPGVAGTDAVNVNQLNAGVANANAYTDQRVNQLGVSIDEVAKKAYAGVASAMAMESAPYVVGKTTYAAGVGTFKGEAALGVSLRRTADNGRWSISGGLSASAGGVAARIGVGGVWE